MHTKRYNKIKHWFVSFQWVDGTRLETELDDRSGAATVEHWGVNGWEDMIDPSAGRLSDYILELIYTLKAGQSKVFTESSIGGGTITYTRVKRHYKGG